LTNFNELGLSEHLLSMLELQGYATPTPIQAKAIPLLLQGRDMIGLAQTGTGKTAAFGLPLIDKLIADGKRPEPKAARALILAPTRELVNQIAVNLKFFVKKTPLKVAIVVGGASINKQMQEVGRGVDILVATPGRLLDLTVRRALTLTATRFLILDEADQMLDLGFIHDLKKIVKMVPQRRQTMLFSATMPKAIADLASDYLTDPVKVEVTPPGMAADKVVQHVHFVTGKDQKTVLLKQMLTANPDGRALVFNRTKHGAEKLMKHLEHCGYSVTSIHGNKSQGQRDRALKSFRDGEVKVLVATDVAARGIDVPGVTHVYNYDLPQVAEAYVHRIGRTARAGREGIAIAFCAPDETKLLSDIERLTGLEITVSGGVRPEGMRRPERAGRNQGQRPAGNGANREPRRNEGDHRPARQSVKSAAPVRSPFAEVREVYDDAPAAAVKARRPEGDRRPQRPAEAVRPENRNRHAVDKRPDARPARPGAMVVSFGADETGAAKPARDARPAGRPPEFKGGKRDGNGGMKRRTQGGNRQG
jgi:ATP-dependent RNA helicase RhlE